MKNDDYGIAGDSRHEQQPEIAQDDAGVPEKDERSGQVPDDRRRDDEREQLIQAEEAIVESAPEEIRDYIAEAMLVKGWSGLLPDPDSFSKYPQHVQDSMVAWNNAKIIDESKRLDKLVDAGIKQVNRENVFSFILNAGFAIISLIAFVATRDPASFGFLAVPGISIVFNGFSILRKEKSDSESEKKKN